jgi:FixJ family two-component response regulator
MKTGERANGSVVVSMVDDDASRRTATRRLLSTFGFRADAFASAQAFLDSGRLQDTACLILDVRMPGMDGLELQRWLARNHRRLPIIFVTAHASAEEEARAMQAGALAFLRKPVSPQDLLSALRAAEVASRRGGPEDAEESRRPHP